MEQRLYFRNTNIDCVRPQFTITYNKERIKGFAVQTVFLFIVILIARTKKLGTVIVNILGGKNMIFHNLQIFSRCSSNVFELYLECMLWCPPLN